MPRICIFSSHPFPFYRSFSLSFLCIEFRLSQAVEASAAVRTDENQRELWAKVTHINESEHSGFKWELAYWVWHFKSQLETRNPFTFRNLMYYRVKPEIKLGGIWIYPLGIECEKCVSHDRMEPSKEDLLVVSIAAVWMAHIALDFNSAMFAHGNQGCFWSKAPDSWIPRDY